ncbi:unnamed protein product [Paramecium sonneborni]|uniref:Uncharacterized protein n=1 Tax=Paramecium sonneborni TaxID=65129 RepID=A0A8S1NIB2_9CILI|nr:unnamed protein product [Paramecium sonneborni]
MFNKLLYTFQIEQQTYQKEQNGLYDHQEKPIIFNDANIEQLKQIKIEKIILPNQLLKLKTLDYQLLAKELENIPILFHHKQQKKVKNRSSQQLFTFINSLIKQALILLVSEQQLKNFNLSCYNYSRDQIGLDINYNKLKD